MVVKNLQIKLIDFGESEHPNVKRSNLSVILDYDPGFTFPFSAPELYQRNPKITDKCDVFSIGVVLF
jgi:serine/threonine protein kinase